MPLAETGYVIDTSGLDVDSIFTSTSLDELKQGIKVTSDGTEVAADQFYLSIDGGALHSGSNTIGVYIVGVQEPIGTFQVTAKQVEIEKMTAELDGTFDIYSSYADNTEVIKPHLTVHVVFNDGTERDLNQDEYSITGPFTPNSLNTFTVTYTEDTSKSCTFEAMVLEQAYKDIRVEFDQNIEVYSSMKVSDFLESTSQEYGDKSMKVFGVYPDGKEEELDFNQYRSNDSFNLTNATEVAGEADTYMVTIVIVDSATGLLDCEVQVKVKASTATSFDSIYDGSPQYVVGDTFVLSGSDFSVRFEDNRSRNPSLGELSVTYPEGTVDDEGRFIQTGRISLTVTYDDGFNRKTTTVNVLVSAASVERPTFDRSPGTYTGQPIERIITGFDGSIMSLEVHRDGVILKQDEGYTLTTDESGNTIFSAIEAGDYTITVRLNENYQWVNNRDNDPSWQWTIFQAPIDPVLVIEGWTYEDTPSEHGYVVHERDDADNTYPGADIKVFYYGHSFDWSINIPRDEAVQTQPTAAGEWTAYAVVGSYGNYSGSTTDDESFTISKMSVDKPVINDIPYDKQPHDVSTETGDYIIMASTQTDVDDYTAIVTMTDAYFANHVWSDTNGQTTTVNWSIIKATVPLPVIQGTWTYSKTGDVEDEKTYSFDSETYADIITLACDDGDVRINGLTLSSTQAGDYKIIISFTSEAAKNYRWEGDGDDTDPKPVTWTIGKAEVSKPTQKVKMPVYNGGPYGYTDGIDIPEGSVELVEITGDTSRKDAGTYTVRVDLKDSDNYKWSETDDSNPFELEWRIDQATNSVTAPVVSSGLVYGEFTFNDGVFSADAVFGDEDIVYMFSRDEAGEYRTYADSVNKYGNLDAVTWYVKAYVAETDNYCEAESGATSFTIAKADNTITLSQYSTAYTYGNDIPKPGYTAEFDDGEIVFQYSELESEGFVSGLPTDANDCWYIRAYYPGSDNYNEGYSESTVTLTINRLGIPYPTLIYSEDYGTVSDDGLSYVYNGSPQIPIVQHGFDYPFDDEMSDAFSSDLSEEEIAGDYPVTFTLGANYKWDDDTLDDPTIPYDKLSWTISKQKIIVDVDQRTKVFDGSVFTPNITPRNPEHVGLYDTTSMPQASTEGEYYVTLTIKTEYENNYEWALNGDLRDDRTPWDSISGNVMEVYFAITKQNYTITVSLDDWTYGDTSKAPQWTGISATKSDGTPMTDDDLKEVYNALNAQRYEWQYSSDGISWDDGVPTNAGQYSVRIHVFTTANFNEAYGYDDFKILRATMGTDNLDGFEGTYRGPTGYSVRDNADLGDLSLVNPESNVPVWKFSLNPEDGFTDDINLINVPTDSADHTYKVYYTVSAPNHVPITEADGKFFLVTINPIGLTVEIESGSLVYDGQTPTSEDLWGVFGSTITEQIQNDVLEGEMDGLILTLSVPDDSITVSGGPYDVSLYCEDTNYHISYTPWELYITPVDISKPNPEITGSPTYNNESYPVSGYISGLPEKTAEGDAITWTFSLTAEGEYTDLSVIDANESGYTVYYKGTAENHNDFYSSGLDSGSQYLTLQVMKRQLTVTLEDVHIQFGDALLSYGTPSVTGFATGNADGTIHSQTVLGLDFSYSNSDEDGTSYGGWTSEAGETYDITVALNGENESFSKNYSYVVLGVHEGSSEPSGNPVLIVDQREITVFISNSTSVYGQALKDPEYKLKDSEISSNDALEDIVSVTVDFLGQAIPSVREYDITGSVIDENGNYAVTFEGRSSGGDELDHGVYTVTAAPVSINFNGVFDTQSDSLDNTYSGYRKEVRYTTDLSGVSTEETYYVWDVVTSDYRQITAEEVIDHGSYRVVITVDSGNYSISGAASQDFQIAKAGYEEFYGISISFQDSTPVYNGQEQYPRLVFQKDGTEIQQPSELVPVFSGGATNVTDGTVSVTVKFKFLGGTSSEITDNINLPVVSNTATVAVQPLTVDVHWGQTVFTYDGTEHTVKAWYYAADDTTQSNMIYLDTTNVTLGGVSAVLKDYEDQNYVVTADFRADDNTLGNYALNESTTSDFNNQTTAEIQKRIVYIQAKDETMIYGDAVPTFTWEYQPNIDVTNMFVNEEGTIVSAGSDIGLVVSTAEPVDSGSPVVEGGYQIIVEYRGLTIGLDNFDVRSGDGALTIQKREISVTINNQESTYDGTGVEPYVSNVKDKDYTVTGDLPSDSSLGPKIVLAKERGTDANETGYRLYIGSYDSTNYDISSTEGKFFIHPAEIEDISVKYGGDHPYGEEGKITHTAMEFETSASTLGGNEPVFEFRFEGDTDYKAAEDLTFSDVGAYKVYYRVSADNHKTVESEDPLEFNITKATNSVDYVEAEGWKFSEEPNDIDSGSSTFGSIQMTIYVGDYSDGKDVTGATTIGSFTNETDAGMYTVRYYVPALQSQTDPEQNNYDAVDERYTIEIGQLPVYVTWKHSSFVFDGQNKTNTITKEEYMAFGTNDGSGHGYSEEPRTETAGNVMTMDYSNAGTFYVWIQLTSKNYCWDTERISDPDVNVDGVWYRAVWYISAGTNGWVDGKTLQDSGFKGWTYNGNYLEPQGVEALHGMVYFMYSTERNGDYSRVPFTDVNLAGVTYYIIAVVDATDSYEGLTSEPLAYNITPCPVTKVDFADGTKTSFVYDESEHSVKLTDYTEGIVEVDGPLSATVAGDYVLEVSLRDTRNYVWEGDPGTSEYNLNWSISKAYVDLPSYGGKYDDEGGYLEYDTTEQTYNFIYDDELIEVTGDSGSAVKDGGYTAVFSLVDSSNYQWPENIPLENGRYQLSWRIDPMKLPIPQLVGEETESGPGGSTVYVTIYSPTGTYISVSDFDSAYMSAAAAAANVSISIVEAEGDDAVMLSANRVSTQMADGLYWIHIDLASQNFIWEDGTHEQKTLYWKVTPIVVELTAGTNVFEYDGTVKTYYPAGYDSSSMFIDDNMARQAGEDYSAMITLRDTVNYVWADSMSGYIQDGKAYMPWSIEAASFDLNGLVVNKVFVYDGEYHLPVFEDLPYWLTIEGYTDEEGAVVTGKRDAGNMTVRVTFTVGPDSNYKLDTSYIDVPIEVNPRQVIIITGDGEMTYGGSVPTDMSWEYAEGSLHLVSGDYRAVDVKTDYDGGGCDGPYVTTAYVDWTDDALAANYILNVTPGVFKVNPIVVPEPSVVSVGYTGDEVQHPFDKTDAVYAVSGQTTGKAIGDYQVTLSLMDRVNYVWWDGTTEDKTITWRIVAGDTLSKDFFQVDTSSETYTGKPITKSVVCLNPNIREGEDYRVEYSNNEDAGEDTAVITIVGLDDFDGQSLSYTFTIDPMPVSIPESVTLEYEEGVEQGPGYSSNDQYTVAGTLEATDVGDYQVTFTLISGNYVWSDGTTGPKTVTWHIVSEHTLLGDYFVVDTSDETYTGQPFDDRVVCVNRDLVEGEDYSIAYSNHVNASTADAPATVTITGLGDYAESAPLVYHFTISKAVPVLDFVNDGFRGYEDDGRMTVMPYLSDIVDEGELVWTSSDPSVAYVDPETGAVSIRGTGTATITAEFPGDANREARSDSYTLNVDEAQTEVVIVPGDTIYVPTVITREVDGGISDLTWLIILACTVAVMLALIWLLWNRRTEGDGA